MKRRMTKYMKRFERDPMKKNTIINGMITLYDMEFTTEQLEKMAKKAFRSGIALDYPKEEKKVLLFYGDAEYHRKKVLAFLEKILPYSREGEIKYVGDDGRFLFLSFDYGLQTWYEGRGMIFFDEIEDPVVGWEADDEEDDEPDEDTGEDGPGQRENTRGA